MEEKLRTEGIHNHFSKVITDTIKVAWAIIIVGIVNVLGEIPGEVENGSDMMNPLVILGVLGGLLAVLLIMALVNFLRWRKTRIIVNDEELIIKNDFLINKKVTTVRLSSIATVNYQRSLFDYVFGTYRLQVDINSSVTADKTDFNLVFDKETAEKVKALLTDGSMTHREHDFIASYGDVSCDDGAAESRCIAAFSFGDVIRHCFLSISVFAIFASVCFACAMLYFAFMEKSFVSTILSLIFVVVPVLWSQLNPLINYYGFTIEKQGDRAVVSYGLFTRRQYNLPLDKTNAIIVHQPILARIFGYYYGELINVGMGDLEDNGIPIFCLLVKKDKLEEIIKELKPELEIRGLGETSPRTAFVPIAVKYIIFTVPVVAAVLCFAPKPFSFAAIPVLLFMILSSVLSYRTKSLAVLSDKAIITSGIFHKVSTVVPNSRIQNLAITTGPVCRRLGLAHGVVTILASTENTTHAIGYFKIDRFEKLSENIVYCKQEN